MKAEPGRFILNLTLEVQMKVRNSLVWAALALVTVVAPGQAQAPLGVPVPPLGPGPWVIDTAEQHKVRISVVARGLSHP